MFEDEVTRYKFQDGGDVKQKEDAGALEKSRQVTAFWNAWHLSSMSERMVVPLEKQSLEGILGWDEFGFGAVGF